MKSRNESGKNILLIHRYFWPDRSSCSAILFYISKNFLNNKNNFDIVTSYPKRFNIKLSKENVRKTDFKSGLSIKRINLFIESNSPIQRIINSILLAFHGSIKLIRYRYDIVIVTSCPPVLTAFILTVITKFINTKLIYYCMDINPEIGMVNGDFKNKFLIKLMLTLDKWTCSNASKVVVHSNSMKNTILKRYDQKINPNIEIINSFTVPLKAKKIQKGIVNLIKNKKGINVIYAGNVGRFQGLENVVKQFSKLRNHKDIRLIILGEGVEKNKLKILSKTLNANIIFLDHVSYEVSKSIIEECDLGLVSLIPDIHKYAYPSKTMAYLEKSVPILGLIEKDSDLSKDIIRNDIGYVIPLNDEKGLINLLLNLNKDHSWKIKLRKNAFEFFKKEFSDKVILKKWNNLIKST